MRRAVEATVDYLKAEIGEEEWAAGMNPEMPGDDEVLDNPYQYTDYKSDSTHGARGTMFGEPGPRADGSPGRGDDDGRARLGTRLRRGAGARARRAGLLRRRSTARCRLTEVATAAGLARPTARRLLLTLEELGFVRSDAGGFQLTPKVLTLGMAYVGSLGLWEIARPHLETLVARTGESSSMAQLDGSDIVYVARVSVPKIIALRVDIGTRFPAAQTSQGKVLLAALSPDELDATLARPSRSGLPHYIGRTEDQLRDRAHRGPRPGLGARRRGARARGALGRGARPGRRRRGAGRDERHRARRGDLDRAAAGGVTCRCCCGRRATSSAEWALWQSRPHVALDSGSTAAGATGSTGAET